MGDLFEMLVKSVPKNFGYSAPRRQAPAKPGGKPSDPITAAALYPRYRDFFKPKDLIVLESGSSNSGIFPLPLPDGAEVQLRRCGARSAGPPGRRLELPWPIHRDEPSSSPGKVRTS